MKPIVLKVDKINKRYTNDLIKKKPRLRQERQKTMSQSM